MEDLPVELLQPICLYSCTDGGFTGSSLSLVSRHFQDISRTVRFHSIGLRSDTFPAAR
ncbi:hypothetical protein BD311DRAFT_722011 [Dichomitus squalens]|uniref:F-box domain-containing protein n=1 Tax=Dichomitus squalens TaxID=114155 RepID=A0A4Q9MM97_9APHY|nr:hypothetical protein BD311DRAFT_722011 [Dichomitus squalens]